MTQAADETDLIRVVLADANVLYSRVLRDYLLYAADQEIIAIAWSPGILAEVTDRLMKNVAGFDEAAAARLVGAMNRAYPLAEVEPGEEHWHILAGVALPDEDDRHVLAAALAAEARVRCTRQRSGCADIPRSGCPGPAEAPAPATVRWPRAGPAVASGRSAAGRSGCGATAAAWPA